MKTKIAQIEGLADALETVSNAIEGLNSVTNESKTTMFTDPVFTGTPRVPTAAPATNTTQIASTAFVTAAVAAGGSGTANKVVTNNWTIEEDAVTKDLKFIFK